ncbi:unnamed protein product [Albugo candida]|uniref:Uncharacterized protein n=1 Tax=Albugo candida TaxID=65357 RepID=A0A024GMI3_9STRA|nr:unnamed protein product [Albugo candida]|eukprot:CCI47973.1 unnamed protein product [Albugo candida]
MSESRWYCDSFSSTFSALSASSFDTSSEDAIAKHFLFAGRYRLLHSDEKIANIYGNFHWICAEDKVSFDPNNGFVTRIREFGYVISSVDTARYSALRDGKPIRFYFYFITRI